MKVLIITGGTSSERLISQMSAKQVKKGLEEMGHQIKLFDLKKGYPALKKISKDFDVIFPVIHGEEGEGGDLQKFLQSLGKPFVGGDWKGYKTGWYKIPFKIWCDKNESRSSSNKILTSPWKEIKNFEDVRNFDLPAVLKSSNGGSSREVVILKIEKDYQNPLLKKLLKSNDEHSSSATQSKLLIEKFLPGVEITVAILNDKALPVLEIVPPEGGWFDYKNKYWGKVKEIPFAPSVPSSVQKKAQEIALKIHKNLNLGQFSRADFIVSEGKAYVLEVNTIPGLTATSLFPKAAQAAGISFPKLLDKIIKLALRMQ